MQGEKLRHFFRKVALHLASDVSLFRDCHTSINDRCSGIRRSYLVIRYSDALILIWAISEFCFPDKTVDRYFYSTTVFQHISPFSMLIIKNPDHLMTGFPLDLGNSI
ncbi:hypothetical protein Dda3937_04461 [Dickeya dadantii 3937]|uniref:Uncharacterized protein n=1 Tax=Dickeya dadantii (strain 3937) TaxID=198628 RepID=E0SK13_DICD3|nr:hypothetical protein Dda3937_04461 [Dickeya dadantii 3937]